MCYVVVLALPMALVTEAIDLRMYLLRSDAAMIESGCYQRRVI